MQRVVYGVMTFQHHPDAIFENFLLQQVFIPDFFIPNFSFVSRFSFFLLICVCICSSYVDHGRVVFDHFHIFFSYTWYVWLASSTHVPRGAFHPALHSFIFHFCQSLVGVSQVKCPIPCIHEIIGSASFLWWLFFCFCFFESIVVYCALECVIIIFIQMSRIVMTFKGPSKDLECHLFGEAVYLWSCLRCYLSSDIL
jgi:hypothetical protein